MKHFGIKFFMVFTILLAVFSLSGVAQNADSTNNANAGLPPHKVKVYEGTVNLQKALAAAEATAQTTNDETSTDVSSELSTLTPESAAPGLSSLYIYAICSMANSTSSLVCEYDTGQGTSISTYPTSLYKIYVLVEMKGYGTNPTATLGGKSGSVLPNVANTEEDSLCTARYTVCTKGQTVTGFREWYDVTSELADGYSRLFYVQSTGINNYPSITLFAQITIQK
jgi:hypothetical protein